MIVVSDKIITITYVPSHSGLLTVQWVSDSFRLAFDVKRFYTRISSPRLVYCISIFSLNLIIIPCTRVKLSHNATKLYRIFENLM